MNNKYKILYTGLIIASSIFGLSSCSADFLNEKLITTESTQSFETQEGLDKLSIGLYQNLEFHFNYEWVYTLWQYGTDEMAVANDGIQEPYNSYTSAFDPSRANGMPELWDNMYSGISSANILIKNVPLYYDSNSANYNTRLGEGYFMRGFNYFRLVCQFGGVPLLKEPVIGATTDFERGSIEDTYNLVISDLKEAYNLLPPSVSQTGRLTKWAAAHFIAKACLFRASELNDSWNSGYKTQDLDDVIKFSKEVITAHPLCNDFVDLWNYQEPNGANEKVTEVVLAAQFSNDASSKGRYGNQVHLYYPSLYQNLVGLKRDISGDREFSRLRTTEYALDVYDRVNDSRFWKSYITSYRCNNPSAAPKWGSYAPAGKTADDPRFTGGEEAVRYIVNDAGDTRYTSDNLNYYAPYMFVRYFKGESKLYIGEHGNSGTYATKSRYVALSKFRDGSRTTVADQFGCRDGILARSAEDYLMVAEAYGRQGKYSEALPYINKLRERAGYADGEVRNKNVDGGQAYKKNSAGHGSGTGFAVYSETNTYYESNNNMPETTAPTKSVMQFASVSDIFNSTKEFYDVLNASSDAEKFMVFIMNERSRELMGELHRWPDLARSKQLEKRFEAFNDGSVITGSAFKASKHYLRPLPQTFLDAVTKNGQSLSAGEKQAMQNPEW
ncbi:MULTISPECIES: RagB/SusD family nutrient uptake outer membrane protein [unclassified Dysgonomonas]|uniref:RagB/SusD family nutrient uptake outer membrane protein n=1 Tax=unclassified Dysgonomonas TaxID=2630389 RepID=UPI0025BF3534|nr:MULTISPECIES: RagB/SusD family nutrient uptake outer membrane protein [unclassified Dysgonomonas]MDR2005084.1 RagB/SusD family nutrient uptake outer membrane protein [Prevotella sp.]HMM02293.1 RagB/SusD family nutrient uptake outer membrane protein [Dysgonomonas sp.]